MSITLAELLVKVMVGDLVAFLRAEYERHSLVDNVVCQFHTIAHVLQDVGAVIQFMQTVQVACGFVRILSD